MIDDRGWEQVKRRGVTILLASVLCLVLVTLRTPTPVAFVLDGDWGYQLAGATQVLSGEHPFIDFKGAYGPLAFYASAAAQALSGRRPIGEIVLVIAGYVTAYVLLFRLFWMASGNRVAAAVVLLFALALMPRLYKYYIVLGPALTLASIWRHVDRQDRRSLWLLAAAIVLTGLFRPDFGVYSFAAGAVALSFSSSPGARGRSIATLAAATLACALPWLVYALVRGGLSRYLSDSTVGAIAHARGMTLPFPRFKTDGPLASTENGIFLCFVMFNLLPLLSVIALCWSRHRPSSDREVGKVLAAIVLAQANLMQALHRAGYNHLLQAAPISLVLAAWLVGRASFAMRVGAGRRRVGAGLSLATLLAFGSLAWLIALRRGQPLRTELGTVAEDLRLYGRSTAAVIERLGQQHTERWPGELLLYVRGHTRPDQRLLVLPAPLTNLYYFTGRRFAGGQPNVGPGNCSTEEDQIKLIERLSREDIALVVDIPGFAVDGLEERKAELFAPILWTYIRQNYEPAQAFGPVVVMRPAARSRR